jgi:hypothetical protein
MQSYRVLRWKAQESRGGQAGSKRNKRDRKCTLLLSGCRCRTSLQLACTRLRRGCLLLPHHRNHSVFSFLFLFFLTSLCFEYKTRLTFRASRTRWSTSTRTTRAPRTTSSPPSLTPVLSLNALPSPAARRSLVGSPSSSRRLPVSRISSDRPENTGKQRREGAGRTVGEGRGECSGVRREHRDGTGRSQRMLECQPSLIEVDETSAGSHDGGRRTGLFLPFGEQAEHQRPFSPLSYTY